MTFVPAEDKFKDRVIYFEDSQAEKIPGYTTTKAIQPLQGEIIDLLQRMGAEAVAFSRPGTFSGQPPRDGYEVMFKFGKMNGKIACAALPVKDSSNERKRQQALKQGLFLLRDQLKAALYTSINKPAGETLVPYLLGDDGMTITESLIASGSVPMIAPPTMYLTSGRK